MLDDLPEGEGLREETNDHGIRRARSFPPSRRICLIDLSGTFRTGLMRPRRRSRVQDRGAMITPHYAEMVKSDASNEGDCGRSAAARGRDTG